MTDYIAARIDDPLVHSSALADFVGGLVEGAIVAGIFLACGTGVGVLVAGVAMGALMFSGKLEETGNAAGKFVDSLIDPGPPDAQIVTGSDNVRIMGKKAARAAGTLSRDFLNTPAAADEGIDWAAVGMLALTGVAAALNTALHPGQALAEMADKASKLTVDSVVDGVSGWAKNVWTSLAQPVVASASPYATPAPMDLVACKKGHMVTSSNFLAEGSKQVLINNQPAVRNGHRSTCEAEIKVAENCRVRIGGDTVVVRDIHSGKNMLAYLAGNILGGALVAAIPRLLEEGFSKLILRGIAKEFVCDAGATPMATGAAEALIGLSKTAFPVNIPLGAKVLAGGEELDFVLQDRQPLIWQRFYHSRNLATGVLGTGWSLPFETRFIRRGDNQLMFRDLSGRELGMGEVNIGDVVDFQQEGLKLFFSPNGAMVLQDNFGESQLYEPDPNRAGEWRLQCIFDRHENAQYYSWNAQGQLVRISSDNEALDVALSYEPQHGRLQSVQQIVEGGRQLLMTYSYNPQGQLVAVTDADGIVTRRFGWDRASDLLAWHSFSTGLNVHYQWQPAADARHWRVTGYQVFDEQQQMLESWRIEADEARRCATVISDAGVTTEHRWDALYRITSGRDAYGGEWQFTWPENGEQPLSMTQPDGTRWEYAYDDRGNLTLERDPLGGSKLTTWHPLWALPLKEVLPDGAVWQYQYNIAGDVVALTDPKGGVTRFEWNTQGDLLNRVDVLANNHRFWWNERGQLVREEDCSGHQSRRTYDGSGRLVRTTDPLGNNEQFNWSAAGRLQKHIRADGRETRYEYSAAGLLRGENIDGMLERRVTRNARGQVTEALDPAGHAVSFSYDRRGRLTALINANRENWRFEYDAAGRLLGQRDYADRLTAWQYDGMGRVMSLARHPQPGSELKPLVTSYEYDLLGRPVVRETAQQRTEYRYSALALEICQAPYDAWRQAAIEESEPEWQRIIFSRNAAGELVSEENHGGVFAYQYDALGNLSSAQFPDGRELSHLRYGTGHLLETQLSHAGQTHRIAGYERDNLHREITRSQGGLTQHSQYDMVGRLTRRRSSDDERQRLVLERRYTWDRTDQVVQQIRTDGEPQMPSDKYQQQLWGYDASGQVTKSVQPQGEEHFWFDPAGNRTDEQRQPVWHNLLKRLNGVRCDYDGFGRLSWRSEQRSGREQHFSYDDEQRIREVRLTGHPDYSRVEYRYDALNRRTHKLLWRHHARQPETVTFDWQGLQLAGEHRDTQPDHYVQYLYSEGSYEPLARVDSIGSSSEVFWYHTELNGLPDRLTDDRGETVWRGSFSTWGETRHESTSSRCLTPQNLRFQGQYLDRETGLHYNLFRYYDPAMARYTQMDPIGLLGGLNTYAYVGDPLTWSDPLGLVGCSTVLGKNMMESYGLPRSTKWKGYQAHHIIPKELAEHEVLKKINYYIDGAENGIFLRSADDASSAMARHQGNHHGYTDAIRDALDKIDPSQSKDSILKQVNNIQATARNGMMEGAPIRSKDMYNADIFGKDIDQIGRERVYNLWSDILR